MKKLSLISLITIMVVVLLPVVVKAQGTPPSPTIGVTIPNPLGTESFIDLINRVIDFLLKVAVPLAALVILYAGFLFLTAGGNEERVKSAKRAFLWAVVGIIILMIARGMVTLIKTIITG